MKDSVLAESEGEVARDQAQFVTVRSKFEKALLMEERVLGGEHPVCIALLEELSNLEVLKNNTNLERNMRQLQWGMGGYKAFTKS